MKNVRKQNEFLILTTKIQTGRAFEFFFFLVFIQTPEKLKNMKRREKENVKVSSPETKFENKRR